MPTNTLKNYIFLFLKHFYVILNKMESFPFDREKENYNENNAL